jgi:hypothetical protein
MKPHNVKSMEAARVSVAHVGVRTKYRSDSQVNAQNVTPPPTQMVSGVAWALILDPTYGPNTTRATAHARANIPNRA